MALSKNLSDPKRASNRITEPLAGLAQAASTSAPQQSCTGPADVQHLAIAFQASLASHLPHMNLLIVFNCHIWQKRIRKFSTQTLFGHSQIHPSFFNHSPISHEYPLVNVYITMGKITILIGKINHFYGHFQVRKVLSFPMNQWENLPRIQPSGTSPACPTSLGHTWPPEPASTWAINAGAGAEWDGPFQHSETEFLKKNGRRPRNKVCQFTFLTVDAPWIHFLLVLLVTVYGINVHFSRFFTPKSGNARVKMIDSQFP